jgi:hypothetical protein
VEGPYPAEEVVPQAAGEVVLQVEVGEEVGRLLEGVEEQVLLEEGVE